MFIKWLMRPGQIRKLFHDFLAFHWIHNFYFLCALVSHHLSVYICTALLSACRSKFDWLIDWYPKTSWYTWLCILTGIVKIFWTAFSIKWKSERQQNVSLIRHFTLSICHLIDWSVWRSLCEGVVVRVVFCCGCGEKFGSGHQVSRVWWRLGLTLRELEGPLAGHLLRLSDDGLSGEGVHPVTKQTVCTLKDRAKQANR